MRNADIGLFTRPSGKEFVIDGLNRKTLKTIQNKLHILCQIGLEAHLPSTVGVLKRKTPRMQHLSPDLREGLPYRSRQGRVTAMPPPIDRVAHNRISNGSTVHPGLVRPPGF